MVFQINIHVNYILIILLYIYSLKSLKLDNALRLLRLISCLSCSKREGNKYAKADNLNDSIQNLSIHGE